MLKKFNINKDHPSDNFEIVNYSFDIVISLLDVYLTYDNISSTGVVIVSTIFKKYKLM